MFKLNGAFILYYKSPINSFAFLKLNFPAWYNFSSRHNSGFAEPEKEQNVIYTLLFQKANNILKSFIFVVD